MKLRPSHPAGELLGRLAERIGVQSGSAGTRVTGVTLRSQDVLPGDLFAALPGASAHGARFAAEAAAAGAVAVLTDPAGAEQLPA
ncbi:MAG: Mur ligase domain-containing protein, partial [Mycobacterium sp.]